MCEAISIKCAHAHTLSTGSTCVSKKKRYIFLDLWNPKNYCIHVLLQRCKLWRVSWKQNHDKKINYAKNLKTWIFFNRWAAQCWWKAQFLWQKLTNMILIYSMLGGGVGGGWTKKSQAGRTFNLFLLNVSVCWIIQTVIEPRTSLMSSVWVFWWGN